MRMKTFRLLVISALVMILLPLVSFSQDSIPEDFCISAQELKLYNLINDYRKAMTLPEISLSQSLCYVARSHARDLFINRPDSNTCNFHSWSDKGPWKACCYEKEIKDRSCMIEKPAEFTPYTGKAYEIIYWENKQATPERAFDQWRETSVARSLITNFKEWEEFEWKAVGIAVYEGFAIAWFGTSPEQNSKTRVCESGQIIEFKVAEVLNEALIINAPTNRSYLIFGSFSSLEDAKIQQEKYIADGFKKAKIIDKDNKFRISLADYPTPELAAEAKKELPSKFKNAWILTF
ncbi:MAG: SPOR domain-containing protein [Bacteroidales bacterium]|nr:SPOR domain-containing protein [Bacteroidales bacterium]